jgi:hypothetical protein
MPCRCTLHWCMLQCCHICATQVLATCFLQQKMKIGNISKNRTAHQAQDMRDSIAKCLFGCRGARPRAAQRCSSVACGTGRCHSWPFSVAVSRPLRSCNGRCQHNNNIYTSNDNNEWRHLSTVDSGCQRPDRAAIAGRAACVPFATAALERVGTGVQCAHPAGPVRRGCPKPACTSNSVLHADMQHAAMSATHSSGLSCK